ncbi:hypothetical protein [Nocardia grenadensis]|uniref:hypothetical protein n=1 Tax=Nocardia grenadensis TaxID=931537 RepID=UPI003D743BFC
MTKYNITLEPEDNSPYWLTDKPRIRVWDKDWYAAWDSWNAEQTLEDWLTDQDSDWFNVTKDYPYNRHWSGTVRRTAYGLEWRDLHESLKKIRVWSNPLMPEVNEAIEKGIEDIYDDVIWAWFRWERERKRQAIGYTGR